jgi:hypothetical protein
MPLDVLLLIFRIATALALYVFLAMLLFWLWRDVRVGASQMTSAQRRFGRLVVVASEGASLEVGDAFPLLARTMLGRAPTNTVVLPDTSVSMEHAHLVLRGGQWWLEDRGSRNGTTLNDVPVEESVVLSTDDVIGIGRVRLRIELTE